MVRVGFVRWPLANGSRDAAAQRRCRVRSPTPRKAPGSATILRSPRGRAGSRHGCERGFLDFVSIGDGSNHAHTRRRPCASRARAAQHARIRPMRGTPSIRDRANLKCGRKQTQPRRSKRARAAHETGGTELESALEPGLAEPIEAGLGRPRVVARVRSSSARDQLPVRLSGSSVRSRRMNARPGRVPRLETATVRRGRASVCRRAARDQRCAASTSAPSISGGHAVELFRGRVRGRLGGRKKPSDHRMSRNRRTDLPLASHRRALRLRLGRNRTTIDIRSRLESRSGSRG